MNASKVWLLCTVHTDLSIIGKKKLCFHVQNCQCGMVGAKIGYALGLLVHDKIVAEFGRNVFLVMKIIRYGKSKHDRMRSNVFMHMITPSVTIQGNITAMRYRDDVNFDRFFFLSVLILV